MCRAGCVGAFRVILVLCQWSLVFVGFNAVRLLYVPPPVPSTGADPWTYRIDPLCDTLNQTQMVMKAVHCVGGTEWRRGCEFRLYSRIQVDAWWVQVAILFVVLSCLYVVVAAWASFMAHDQTEKARRERQDSKCSRLFQENMALSFWNGANLAHGLIVIFATVLLIGCVSSPHLRKCAPLDPDFNPENLNSILLGCELKLDPQRLDWAKTIVASCSRTKMTGESESGAPVLRVDPPISSESVTSAMSTLLHTLWILYIAMAVLFLVHMATICGHRTPSWSTRNTPSTAVGVMVVPLDRASATVVDTLTLDASLLAG